MKYIKPIWEVLNDPFAYLAGWACDLSETLHFIDFYGAISMWAF